MSNVQRETVIVTTDASGNATAYSGAIMGKIEAIHYVKGDFADGVDFTITGEKFAEGIWAQSDVNASASKWPRLACHDLVGVAATTDGTRALRDKIALANDRVKIAIAQGGNAKSGTFHIIYS